MRTVSLREGKQHAIFQGTDCRCSIFHWMPPDVPPRSPADPAAPGAQELFRGLTGESLQEAFENGSLQGPPLKTQKATQRELKRTVLSYLALGCARSLSLKKTD